MEYRVDLRDIKFQLLEWLPIEQLLQAKHFAEWDRESIELVLDEALRVSQERLAPANQVGDRDGVRFENGRVQVSDSYPEAYRTVAEGGWIGCVNSPLYGGMGLPHSVGNVVIDFFSGANLSLALVFLLTRGASELIEKYGDDELRSLFCEKLYSGQWTGTMCLTEPQAGSDVGASAARAVKQDNGRYLISGEKIFITYGDHNMADNIVHTVLARLPDAPPGTRGLSLFVVPKFRANSDGSVGQANDVQCASIEHKLGIHGSPTCSILFGADGACEGFLLGEENRGMKLMFNMMNAARIEVGQQSAGVAGAAHQAALAYAKERVQSRHWTQMADRQAQPVPIVEHPDVRRMLLTSSAYTQAMRALILQTSFYIDMATVSEGEDNERYQSLVDILTPLCKAWCSDWGFRVTEWSLQVFGGCGYIKDYPAEQYLRDAKIASIYEGTNGIQALDLVVRKLSAKGGRPFRELLTMAGDLVATLANDRQLGKPSSLLGSAINEIADTLTELENRSDRLQILMLNAVPLLDMVGFVLGGYFLLDQANMAQCKLDSLLERKGVDKADAQAVASQIDNDPDAAFYQNKILSASHFAYRALPQVKALGVALRAAEMAPIEAVM